MSEKEKSPHAGGQGGGGKNITSNNNNNISSPSSFVNPLVTNIPQELKQLKQWVCWRYENRNGKPAKVPISPHNEFKAATNNSRTWSSFVEALRYYANQRKNGIAGIGFMFTDDDPYCGIDLDDCRDPQTGKLTPVAQEFVETTDSYAEISPSGMGIHIFVKAKPRGGGRRKRNPSIEIYYSSRYFTMTGNVLDGRNAIQDRQEGIDALLEKYLDPQPSLQPGQKAQQRDTKTLQALTDEKIIKRAMNAKNSDKFKRLMSGDLSEYSEDHSGGDMALCNILAFWTKDPQQIDRLFRQSRLMRPKWDKKHSAEGLTYGQMTIQRAINNCLQIDTSVKNGDMGDDKTHSEKKNDSWAFARKLFPRREFPWDVLPPAIAESLKQLASSCAGSPNPLPGLSFCLLAGVLGRTISVSPKEGWDNPLIFWHADIRESGDGKTAPARFLSRVIQSAQKKEHGRYQRAIRSRNRLTNKQRKIKPPPKPPRGFFATDLTIEGLHCELENHPTGGVAVILNELSAFITSQDQYKKRAGSDREAWICLHDGDLVRILRAGRSPILIRGARVQICGGIQPQVFKRVFTQQRGKFLEDGTIFRFLFTYEPSTHYELTHEVWSDPHREPWERTLSNALEWANEQAESHPNESSRTPDLSPDAQNRFFEWRNDLDSQKSELPQQLRGFLPKAYGNASRFAAVLHCMDRFSQDEEPAENLSLEEMERGIQVVEFYLAQTVDAMWLILDESSTPPVEISQRTIHLANTLELLKPDIESGRLAVGYIWKKFNSTAPPAIQLNSARAMGALLRDCGLTIAKGLHDFKGKRRLRCLVWGKKTEQFINHLSNVSKGSDSHNHAGSEMET